MSLLHRLGRVQEEETGKGAGGGGELHRSDEVNIIKVENTRDTVVGWIRKR